MSPVVSLSVLFVAAEMAPLAKAGGVGDVGSALPRALRRLGVDVRVVLPYYAAIRRQELPTTRIADLPHGAAIWETRPADVSAYLIEHEASFDRDRLYGYGDEVERFLVFCDAVVASASALDWRPYVIHLNDWLTGFVATRLVAQRDHRWAGVPRVFTVHNLGYRGDFLKAFARAHAFPSQTLAAPRGVSRRVPYSGLAQGILHSDLVSAVSATYAREVLTPQYGGALVPLLQRLGDRLAGIMNGIDTDAFDPATDPHLPATFDAERLHRRSENKRVLQERSGLPIDDGVPLVGIVTRLVVQKGSDLAANAIERLLGKQTSLQLVVLGQGDPRYERQLSELAARWPQQVAVQLAFDVAFGQLIYGGSDIFLMPSRYEPCGLGQMIAMRYGAVPVVRRTGGLADSVQPYDRERGSGTGFLFDQPRTAAVAAALEEAFTAYRDGESWRALQRRAMAQDFSWERAARAYAELYSRAIALARERS